MNFSQRSVKGFIFLAVLIVGGAALIKTGTYGWTLFLMMPTFVGGLSCWIMQPPSAGRALYIGATSCALALLSFLVLGIEGIICIVMSLPLAIPFGMLGSYLVYLRRTPQAKTGSVAILMLLTPASLTWDISAQPPVYEVHSFIEIAAPPERVWNNVVSFPELAEPQEWYFRTGLGYPERTRIDGAGVGAARYCDFSTGSFVESVEIWDQPRLLQFSVTSSAPPMKEWSPYGDISPKHLHGYFVSKRGQFKLTELPNHHTLVEGTSWYQHGLWPAEYWHGWSDAIIHRIHTRVLRHIKALSEADVVAVN